MRKFTCVYGEYTLYSHRRPERKWLPHWVANVINIIIYQRFASAYSRNSFPVSGNFFVFALGMMSPTTRSGQKPEFTFVGSLEGIVHILYMRFFFWGKTHEIASVRTYLWIGYIAGCAIRIRTCAIWTIVCDTVSPLLSRVLDSPVLHCSIVFGFVPRKLAFRKY